MIFFNILELFFKGKPGDTCSLCLLIEDLLMLLPKQSSEGVTEVCQPSALPDPTMHS